MLEIGGEEERGAASALVDLVIRMGAGGGAGSEGSNSIQVCK